MTEHTCTPDNDGHCHYCGDIVNRDWYLQSRTYRMRFMGQTYDYSLEELRHHASRGRKPYGHVDKHTDCRCSVVCTAATHAKRLDVAR
jgi:hypothetical protein